MSSKSAAITSFDHIHWPHWMPDQTATLLFVIQNNLILLIRKKRGLGAGKINGPGGRIDPGETPKQCAIREAQEELHITPTGVEFAGDLYFQFADGFKLQGYVFCASGFEGTPTETDEATPLWFPVDAIPYEEMWSDDRYWLPLMLKRQHFVGRFLFDGDAILGYDLTHQPSTAVLRNRHA